MSSFIDSEPLPCLGIMAATQPPGSGITLYAELLSNIRQVSVVATLASASDAATKAQVVEGGTAIRIHHHGHTQSLALPAPAAAPGSLPIPTHPSTQLSWRIPVSTQVPKVSSFSLENQALPWNAVDIQTGAAIRCRKCDHAIVEEGAITSWKDLPSENWAEMMEFWHCHKPHDHGDEEGHGHDRPDDEHLTKRGYGASNAISAKSGVGFVDITSFMFSEADCNGLSVSVNASPPSDFGRVTSLSLPGKKEVGLVGSPSPNTMTWSSIQLPKTNVLLVVPAIS